MLLVLTESWTFGVSFDSCVYYSSHVHKLTLHRFPSTDISHNQNEVAYSHKVSDTSLSCISIEGSTQGGGKLVAVGDANGTVSMLEVCDSLAKPAQNEKGKEIKDSECL